MNEEEINDIQTLEVDINDIDDLALGLEICSKKSNMVIQEFANMIINLQQENKQLKEELYEEQRQNNELEQDGQDIAKELAIRIDKAIEYMEKRKVNIKGDNIYCFDDRLLEILKGE